MKKTAALLSIVLAFAVPAVAQVQKNDGLVLTGALVSVKANGTDGDEVLFELALYMQLRNDSARTLIARRPSTDEVTLEFLDSLSPNDDGSSNLLRLTPFKYPCRYTPCDKPYSGPAQSEEIPAEPHKGFVVLEPGKYYEFVELVTIKGAYSLSMKPGETYIDVRKNEPQSKFPALRLTYHVSDEKYSDRRSLFLTLQERWKKFGHLVLDSNGDITLRSDTILNRQGSPRP